MTQYNYRYRYLVVINENTYVSVYKYEKFKFDQPFLSFQVKNIFIGKSKVRNMTDFSRTLNKSNFDGNTILLECEENKYFFISGLEIFEFRTFDKNLDYISLMGNKMIPYTFAVGEKYTYYISTHNKFTENDRIQEGILLNSSNDCLNHCGYHLSKNGLDCFRTLLLSNTSHNSWPGIECGFMEEIVVDEEVVEDEEDVQEDVNIHELEYTDGSNKVVKIFNQKCVICFERDSEYIFKQCGHECLCQECYQNKGNIDLIKCVICRT